MRTDLTSSNDIAIALKRNSSFDSACNYAQRSRSDSTWRTYKTAWLLFEEYCQSVVLTPLPANPKTVAMFIAYEADSGKSVSTLAHRLAAIRLVHLGNGYTSPHNAQSVTEVLQGVRNSRKELGELPNRKAPAVDAVIKRLVDQLDTNSLRGKRDRAILLYGFAGALRRSELVRVNVSHIEIHDRGHLLTIPYSKADQTGKGQTIGIVAQPNSPYCPIAALEEWMYAAQISEGAVFKRFYKGDTVSSQRLGDRAVAEIIKDGIFRLKDRSLDYRKFSAHSLRCGFLTSASANKASVFKLIAQSRHKQLNTLMAYVSEQDRFESHAAEQLLLAIENPKE